MSLKQVKIWDGGLEINTDQVVVVSDDDELEVAAAVASLGAVNQVGQCGGQRVDVFPSRCI